MRRSIDKFLKIISSEDRLDIPRNIDELTALYYMLNEHIQRIQINIINDKFNFICTMIDKSSKDDAINMNGLVFTIYDKKLLVHSEYISGNTINLLFTKK